MMRLTLQHCNELCAHCSTLQIAHAPLQSVPSSPSRTGGDTSAPYANTLVRVQ